VRDAREDAVPRVYGGRGEELGGRESDIRATMTGRKKGRANLNERVEMPGLVFEESAEAGEKAAQIVSNPAMATNYYTRVIARELQKLMDMRTIFELCTCPPRGRWVHIHCSKTLRQLNEPSATAAFKLRGPGKNLKKGLCGEGGIGKYGDVNNQRTLHRLTNIIPTLSVGSKIAASVPAEPSAGLFHLTDHLPIP
jgi:hypothetical protein